MVGGEKVLKFTIEVYKGEYVEEKGKWSPKYYAQGINEEKGGAFEETALSPSAAVAKLITTMKKKGAME